MTPRARARVLLRLSAAAQRLSIKPRTVKKWIHQGRLQGVRLDGGHWRVEEAEIERYLRNKTGTL